MKLFLLRKGAIKLGQLLIQSQEKQSKWQHASLAPLQGVGVFVPFL